jgi:hypothetical protein
VHNQIPAPALLKSNATNFKNHSPSKQAQIAAKDQKAFLLPRPQNQKVTPFNAIEVEVNLPGNGYLRVHLVPQITSVRYEHGWILFVMKMIDLTLRCAAQSLWEGEVEVEMLDRR